MPFIKNMKYAALNFNNIFKFRNIQAYLRQQTSDSHKHIQIMFAINI